MTTRRHPLLPFLLAATLALDALFVFIDRRNGFNYPPILSGPDPARIMKGGFAISYTAAQFFLLGYWVGHKSRFFASKVLSASLIFSLVYLYQGQYPILKPAVMYLIGYLIFFVTLSVSFYKQFQLNKIQIRFRLLAVLQLTTAIALITYHLTYIGDLNKYDISITLTALIAALMSALILVVKVEDQSEFRWIRLPFAIVITSLCSNFTFSAITEGEELYISDALVISIFLLTYWFTIFVWLYSLNLPKQRRKREQAALALPEQPVRLHNQDVDQLDSSESIEPDDEAPGPIDLRV